MRLRKEFLETLLLVLGAFVMVAILAPYLSQFPKALVEFILNASAYTV